MLATGTSKNLASSSPQLLQPPANVDRRRAAFGAPPADSSVGRQIGIYIAFYLRREALQLAERQFLDLDAALDTCADDLSDDSVSGAKRHAARDEIIREIGLVRESVRGGSRHALLVDFDAGGKLAHDRETRLGGIDRIEERPLVFLQVAIIGGGQSLHDRQQRLEMAEDATCFPADKLRHVGIFFLRHHGAAGAETVGKLDETELRTRP